MIVVQALDYVIDRPRLLGINATPPVFEEGSAVTLEALLLGPESETPAKGVWKVCGIEESHWVSLWSLDCFRQEDLVTEIAQGIPAMWTPPALKPFCNPWLGIHCAHYLPFVLETEMEGELVRGSFGANVFASDGEPYEGASFRDVALEIVANDPAGGVVELHAVFDRSCDSLVFRWYVDGGVLLDTGRTAVQGREGRGVWSRNRWVIPEGRGPFRAVVVVSAIDAWGCERMREDPFLVDAPNMTWATILVEAP
jgi:hypothetical protein